MGPDKQISFELVAEIVQRRWLTGLAERPCEFYGGSTIIIGPDGQIRYLISKSVTNAQRAAAQAQHLNSAEPGKAWEGRDGRLFVPQMALRALHECAPRVTGSGPQDPMSPEDAQSIQTAAAATDRRSATGGTDMNEAQKMRQALADIAKIAKSACIDGPHGHVGGKPSSSRSNSSRHEYLLVSRKRFLNLAVTAAQTAMKINPVNGPASAPCPARRWALTSRSGSPSWSVILGAEFAANGQPSASSKPRRRPASELLSHEQIGETAALASSRRKGWDAGSHVRAADTGHILEQISFISHRTVRR